MGETGFDMKTKIPGFFKNKKRVIIVGTLLCILLIGVIYFASFDRKILKNDSFSTTFFDRNGTPLRTFFS
jgi:membrane carboxypeptidase/penicillin-binding protein PbpC